MATRFTKRTVEQLLARDRTVIHYDAELKGFGLRITPAGARAWIVEYRPNGGGRRVATKRMTLGTFTTLTPNEARRRARDVLAAVRIGEDPASARARQRELPTFADLAQRFLLDQVGRLRPRTLVNYELYFRRYAIPHIGGSKINAITTAEITRLHRVVGREKPITANRVVRAVSSLLAYAEEAGVVQRGYKPTAGIKLYSEQGKERFLSLGELERLGAALRLAETEGLPWRRDASNPRSKYFPKNGGRTVLDPRATAAIRLLLFTGCRLREILHLRWSDIDLEHGLAMLPSLKNREAGRCAQWTCNKRSTVDSARRSVRDSRWQAEQPSRRSQQALVGP
jgi:hypothetical protein